MSGLAGMVGFPTVGARAAELEHAAGDLDTDRAAVDRARLLLYLIRSAFVKDLADTPSLAADAPAVTRDRSKVLIAEDDDDQRAIVMGYLRAVGYEPLPVCSGDQVLAATRAGEPSVILLDVGLPGLDGYSVCRLLKTDPALAAIPVLFMTTRSRMDERLAGLALGADEYLIKPVDLCELSVRIERARTRARDVESADLPGAMPYGEFFERSRRCLANSPASAVFIRVPPEHTEAATAFIKDDVRRRDIFGAYDQSHLVLLLPELPAAVACDRITGIIARLKEAGVSGITAGVAVSPAPGGKSIEDLMVEADEALVEARYLGKAAVVSSDLSPRRDPAQSGYTVLVADDDPDLTRIVDAQMRAAGYTPSLVFDGEQALAALDKSRPDVLVLDLMMPKRNGFEVLAKLNQREGPRPSVIVLSARGREDDVTRAFDLGANDYMTKPFSPQELLARVARLLR